MRAITRRIAIFGSAASLAAGLGPPAAANTAETTSAAILGSHAPEVRSEFQEEGLVMLKELSPEGHIRALVRFERPRQRVIRLLSQTGRHHEFRPELYSVETHSYDASGALDTHRMKIMFMRIDYRLRHAFDFEAYRISWALDPEFENGLEDVDGYWELFEIDEGTTLGRFGTRVSVGPGLPGWLQDAVTRKNVPEAMDNVKRWIDTDGTYRP